MKKTLLDMRLLLDYYKGNNILDTYKVMMSAGRLVLDKDVMDILDKVEKQIFIEPLNKSIEKDREIERLNNIINEFNEFIEEVYNHINLGDESDEFMLVFDKWQELKGVDKE